MLQSNDRTIAIRAQMQQSATDFGRIRKRTTRDVSAELVDFLASHYL